MLKYGSIITNKDKDRNIEGKRIIPYTQTNSMFYIKDSAEPLPFLTIAPNKVDSDSNEVKNMKPADPSEFLHELGRSIQKMKKHRR